MKILLVDDSKSMHRILKTQLCALEGVDTVVEAVDGRDAMIKLRDNMPVDLITLDLNMPTMDGLTFLKRVRKNPAYNDVTICVISSSSDKKTVVEAILAGANKYIIKPFTPEILRERLGLREKPRQLPQYQTKPID